MLSKLRIESAKNGLTLTGLAKTLNISKSYLSNINKGKYDLNNPTVIKIADFFKMDVDKLF